GPPCAKDHLQHTAIIRWTASQASHLVARMPPEMQPPPSALSREVIIISVFVLVEGRKRRDSNPRCLSARSLSSCSARRRRAADALAGDLTQVSDAQLDRTALPSPLPSDGAAR